MAKKNAEKIGLDRSSEAQKPRRRWWAIGLVLVVVLVIVGVIWVNSIAIRNWVDDTFNRPTPPPVAEEQAGRPGVLYETDFEAQEVAENWEIFDDGTVRAALNDGQLVVGATAYTDTGTWSGINLTFEDFVLDVDATKIDGPDDNGIVIIFRLADLDNYYRFDISSDGYYALSKVRAGEAQTVSEFHISPAIQTGTGVVNHIRVRAVGNQFRFEVNATPLTFCVNADPAISPLWENDTDPDAGCIGGEVVGTWEDGDLARGKIGLGVQAFMGFDPETGLSTQAVAVVAFDNLIIWSPTAQEVQE